MPVPFPFPVMDKDCVKYEVPIQTKMYFCNQCQNERNSLRWVEKFSNQGFKCDNCWHQFGA
jgi:hypothetical protein